ncbi:MBOAT family O-acyltransferase [Frisingicoccus sp.]|uniref:MBOAT family O-acyltransferase n=1 Tax=Frisingicoccus sp. TaxID=1918627 RepID=UPI002A8057BE|nr:MBOAT family O-acyltransferase [Frisingicoccus sp.]
MVFSSLTFLCIFLPMTIILYYLLPSIKMKNILLIIVSLLFYSYGEPIYVFLMLGSTIVNYFLGLWIEKSRKKYSVFIAILLNLSVLGIFKYTDMMIMTVNQLVGCDIPMAHIKLPIGISFFTFQIMSYIIDVYREETEAQKNYARLLLYISFFPQLIAGPIIKYHDVAEQIVCREMSVEKLGKGFRRFIIGLSKKVLISNAVALTADRVFALELSRMNSASAWIGALAYLLQIYYDFSGYSDMAIGLGYMFGFEFMENFQYPYAATSMQIFWRRWHISLSTWFKEYLYIPLGGNQKGKLRTCINKIIVFFSTGLWHGANWTFVVWGLYHGIFLLLEEVIPIKKMPKLLGHLYAVLITTCGFVIFRADTLYQGISVIGKMFAGWDLSPELMNIALRYCTPHFIFILVIGAIGAFPWKCYIETKMLDYSVMIQNGIKTITYVGSLALLILCVLNLSSGTYNPFIYFRF